MTGIVMAERCQGPCGKYIQPSLLVNWGPHIRICENCRNRHSESLDVMAGTKTPNECQHCHTSIEALKARSPTGEPKFHMHHLDGVYVALCETCNAEIERLMKHMYRNTPHGTRIQ